MKSPLLIGLTGKAGCGKTTAGKYLEKSKRLQMQSFAEPMKLGIQKMFGLTDDQVFGDKDQKEQPIPKLSHHNPISGRYLMQTLATEWAREFIHPDVWIWPVEEKWNMMKGVPGFAGFVIHDLRFENEAKWLRRNGGIVIEIVSPGDDIMRNQLGGHKSEKGIPANLIDMTITNFKQSKEEFYAALDKAINILTFDGTIPASNVNKPVQESLTKLIVDWANEVFPNRTITNAIQKMVFEEIPEYLLKQDDPMELADIGILLYDISNLAGVDLEKAIREKMAINKKRQWQIDDKTGLMNHIKTDGTVVDDHDD